MFSCRLCQNVFKKKQSLQVHLSEKRCKSEYAFDLVKLHHLLEQKDTLIDSLRTTPKDFNININIEINPITKLKIDHIDTEKMKRLIEIYDKCKTPEKLNILLSGYIKDLMCDSEHPENHAVKYVKKKPPTYNSLIEDINGNTVNVIKGLKDTCELLSHPILDKLKVKLIEFIKKYKPDEDPDFDFSLYEDVILQLKKEFNRANVKKALSSVLQNDILNNIQMKLNYQI